MKPNPIFPIGSVNLSTGKNAMHGTVWDCWPVDSTRLNILVRDLPLYGKSKFKVIHAVTEAEVNVNYAVDGIMYLKHDQSGHNLGDWQIVGFYPHTPHGLADMRTATGKRSIPFACFK